MGWLIGLPYAKRIESAISFLDVTCRKKGLGKIGDQVYVDYADIRLHKGGLLLPWE